MPLPPMPPPPPPPTAPHSPSPATAPPGITDFLPSPPTASHTVRGWGGGLRAAWGRGEGGAQAARRPVQFQRRPTLPLPRTRARQVRVCCLPSRQLSSIGASHIAPDLFGPWPYSLRQMLGMALEPAEQGLLEELEARGRADARGVGGRERRRRARGRRRAGPRAPMRARPRGAAAAASSCCRERAALARARA